MNELTLWQKILMNNTPVVLVLFAVGFAVMSRLLWLIVQQQRDMATQKEMADKEIREQKDLVEKTELSKLTDRIVDLLDRFKDLSRRNDENGERLDILEKKQVEHGAQCVEREKSVNDRLKVCHHRVDTIEKRGAVNGI